LVAHRRGPKPLSRSRCQTPERVRPSTCTAVVSSQDAFSGIPARTTPSTFLFLRSILSMNTTEAHLAQSLPGLDPGSSPSGEPVAGPGLHRPSGRSPQGVALAGNQRRNIVPVSLGADRFHID